MIINVIWYDYEMYLNAAIVPYHASCINAVQYSAGLTLYRSSVYTGLVACCVNVLR